MPNDSMVGASGMPLDGVVLVPFAGDCGLLLVIGRLVMAVLLMSDE